MNYVYRAIDHSSSLSHHGIKGQKWGVRNGPPYPIEDKVMKKGTVLRSVSGKYLSGQSYKRANHPIYTYNANDEWDRKVYTGPFAYFDVMYRGAQFVAEHEFETARDLKMPTSKERIDEFKDLYNDKKFNKKAIKEMKSIQTLMKKQNIDKPEVQNLNLNKLQTEEDYKNAYKIFNHAMEAAHRYKSTTEYMKRMSSKYDAMVDDNNVNVYNAAHDPVIIFKTNDLIERNGGYPVSMLNVNTIVNNVDEVRKEMKKMGRNVSF